MDNYQTKITCSNLFYFLHFFSYCTKIKQTIWNDPNCIKIDSKLYYNKVFYVYKPSIEYKSTKTANLGHISIIKKHSAVVAPNYIFKFSQNLQAQNWPPKQNKLPSHERILWN